MSDLLVPFLYELRRRGVRVGATETVSLARAVSLGLHGSTLDGFYYVARALCVHRDADLDRFDQAFLHHFRGAAADASASLASLEDALSDPAALADAARAAGLVEGTAEEYLHQAFAEALADEAPEDPGEIGATNQERGERGRGRRGLLAVPGGAGAARGSRALGMADARRYRRYRSDLVLDVRQIEVALRRLRAFSRDGRPEELDVEATVDRTARAFGDLEVVLRSPRKSSVRVLLLMDVGGSMEPYAQICSQLFSAAKRASNLRELRAYYFHNVPYGRVFSSDGRMTPLDLPELFERVHGRWKLVMVGDASMAPGEMLSVGPWGLPERRPDGGPMRGFDWLVGQGERFERSVWLNPDPPSYWVGGTVEIISQVFQMYPLTVDGLGEAVAYLAKDGVGRRPPHIENPRNAL